MPARHSRRNHATLSPVRRKQHRIHGRRQGIRPSFRFPTRFSQIGHIIRNWKEWGRGLGRRTVHACFQRNRVHPLEALDCDIQFRSLRFVVQRQCRRDDHRGNGLGVISTSGTAGLQMFTCFEHEPTPNRVICGSRARQRSAARGERSGSRRGAEVRRFFSWFAFASGGSHVICRRGAQIARTSINSRSEKENRNWDDWTESVASLRQQAKA